MSSQMEVDGKPHGALFEVSEKWIWKLSVTGPILGVPLKGGFGAVGASVSEVFNPVVRNVP